MRVQAQPELGNSDPSGGPTSRRALLSGAGAGVAALGALLLTGCGSAASTSSTTQIPAPTGERDVEILQAALELERRTVAAYVAGIPLLPRPQAKAAEQFVSEELEHTGQVISLIKMAGGQAGPRANSYPLGHPTDAAGVLTLLHSLEAAQITYYLQSIPRLSPGPIRAGAATILTVDAEHIAMLRLMRGQEAVPSAFVTGAE